MQTLVDKDIAHQAFNLQATIEGAIGTVAGEFIMQEMQISAMKQYLQAQKVAQNANQQSPANAMSKYGFYRNNSNAAQSGGAASSAYGSGNGGATSKIVSSNATTTNSGQAINTNVPINQSPIPLIFKPGLQIIAQGPIGYVLYDDNDNQYLTYNNQDDLSISGDLGVIEPVAPDKYILGFAGSVAVSSLASEALNDMVGDLVTSVPVVQLINKVGRFWSEIVDDDTSVDYSISDSRAGHIFRDEPGHLPDTPENRELLTSVANDPSTTLGIDEFGVTWSALLNEDDTQIWVQTRGDQIINGGLNQVPRQYNPQTGLSASMRPGQNN